MDSCFRRPASFFKPMDAFPLAFLPFPKTSEVKFLIQSPLLYRPSRRAPNPAFSPSTPRKISARDTMMGKRMEPCASTPFRSFTETGTNCSFKDTDSGTPLAAVAEAFEELARSLEASSVDLKVAAFSDACSLVSVLFGYLGFAFKFAEMEYVSKVNDLIEASNTYDTLNNILDHDVEHDTVRKQGSHSRNLRRVRLGLDLIKALFERFLSSDECSLKEAASTAYGQVCAPFHTWAVRKAVGAGMCTLPTREQLLLRLYESDFGRPLDASQASTVAAENSVQREMRRYIEACSPVIEYIDNLFLSRNICLDW